MVYSLISPIKVTACRESLRSDEVAANGIQQKAKCQKVSILKEIWLSPSKTVFENYKPRGLFSEFYGT